MFKRLFGAKDQNIESDSHMRALSEYKKRPDLDFYKAQKKLGMDGATSYSHLYFSGLPLMTKFRRELELQTLEYSLENKNYEILIVVPDSRLGSEVKNQKMVEQITHNAIGSGFHDVHRVDLKARSAIDGARQLFNVFKERQKSKKIILVSFSHGSASVRIMLDQLSFHSVSSIKGWINLSGLIFGSPTYFCSNKKSTIMNRNHEIMRSYSSEQKYFLNPMRELPIKKIHFLGMNLSSQMTVAQKRKCGALKAWGPNDGLIAFANYQRLKEPVVSVMGQGHYIDLETISSTFSRSLCSIVGLIPKGTDAGTWISASETSPSETNKNSILIP